MNEVNGINHWHTLL